MTTIINNAQKGQIVAYSYEDQLIYLAGKLAQDNKALGFDTLMILSLAESVKLAREADYSRERLKDYPQGPRL